MLCDGLTYSLWCIEGSELALGEAGAGGGRLALTGPGPLAERRAAARRRRRRRTTTNVPISAATRATPPITPVENSSVRLEVVFGET